MKRRDFVKNAGLATLGLSVLTSLDSLAEDDITYLSSADLSESTVHDNNYPINFMAVGDWGRNGEFNQLAVSKQMGTFAANNPNDFIISTGDNFYPEGVVSENDPLWNFSFENIYTAHKLQCDWYPVLGNHDYGADPDAQVRYSKVSRRWNMPARYYTKEISLENSNNDKVLFVLIDTDPMLFESKKDYVDQQLKWLEHTLTNASAKVKWKIVVGHHPCYTVGPRITNHDTLAVRNMLTKVFNKHKVDMYLSGHDHSLQHLKPEGFTHQFISGAGSELTPVTADIAHSRFQLSENGFMYFSINADTIRAKAITSSGTVVYETILNK